MTCWTKIPSLGNLDAYIRAIDKFPMLTLEEEQEAGRTKDVEKLVLSHLRFAAAKGREFWMMNSRMEHGDFIQEANIALVEAASKFDPERGVRFVSFATLFVKSALSKFVMNNARTGRIVVSKQQRSMFQNLTSRKTRFLKGTNRTVLNVAEVEAIAKEFDIDPFEVRDMESRLANRDLTTSRIVGRHDGSSMEITLEDTLGDTRYDPAELMERAEKMWLMEVGAEEALVFLDERTAFMVKHRHMVEEPLGLKDLAAIWGISMERCRQIEVKGLKQLREHLKEYA